VSSKHYLVEWVIDSHAETPREAAQEAFAAMQRPETWANFFVVTDKATGERTDVDLLLNTMTPNSDRLVVWLAAISHRHGVNTYVAAGEDALEAQVAAFCREYWDELRMNGTTEGLSDAELISRYFGSHHTDTLVLFESSELPFAWSRCKRGRA
jgi:hypothetical protein